MSHYVVGDVQGCFDELISLCKKIKFNPNKDKLIFAGDFVLGWDSSQTNLEYGVPSFIGIK